MQLIEEAQEAKEKDDEKILLGYANFISNAERDGLMTFSTIDEHDGNMSASLRNVLHKLSCVLHLSRDQGKMSMDEQVRLTSYSCIVYQFLRQHAQSCFPIVA